MLRSKQLLPFAKGARAWIVGGTVTKSNPLDNPKPSIPATEDGSSEPNFSTNGHGHGSNYHLLVPKLEETTLGPDTPLPTAAFSRLRPQQSASTSFIPPSSLPKPSAVNPSSIPSRKVNVLLSSPAVKHHIVEKTAEIVDSPSSAAGAGPRARALETTTEAHGNQQEAAFVASRPKDLGFAAVGRISNRSSSYSDLSSKLADVPARSSTIEARAGAAADSGDSTESKTLSSTLRPPPLQETKPSIVVSTDGRNASLNHTIFFGSLDAPVVVPRAPSLSAETPPASRRDPPAERPARLNTKSFRADAAPQKQRTPNPGSRGGGEKGPGGFPNTRKKLGAGVGQARNTSYRARRDNGWEAASNEMVDQVSGILRRLGWTPETIAALGEFNSKLGAYHINEVLKHQREPSLAWEFFNWAKCQRGYKHDVLTYTTMIGILGRVKNFDACNMLLASMRKEGCEPSVVTFNRLIHSYGRANYLGEALKLFRHMQEVGCQPDRVTYCTLIDLHSKSGLHDTAMDICDQMWKAGFQPDTFSYTLIIHCLGKAGNLPAAYKMFSEMIDRGCTPNLVTYNIMIDLHAKAGKYHLALKLYNDMQDAGHRPDRVTYSVIMEVLGHSGHTDEAEEVFFEMDREGWTPDAPTFGLLVNMWGLDGNVEKASEWYMKMLDSGLTPNAPTINSLLGAYLRAHQYDGAMQVLQSLGKWGLTPTLPTYTLLLNSCTTCERPEDVDSILQLMRSTGHPAHGFLCQLLDVSGEESRAHVQQFFQALRLEDREIKRGFADALIEFLYRSEHKSKAGHVWEVAMENNLYPLAVSQRIPNNWIVDLHVMSTGTALVALVRTLVGLRERMLSTGVVPDRIEIVTGWGKHSRVSGFSLVKNAVQNMLAALGSPFYVDTANVGCFVGAGQPLADWLHQAEMDHLLAL